jgi:prepilin-type N-terminal cleavage/methylation domain-containing protein
VGNYFRGASFRGNKGFTLIEMAIVLVIIGLILGAVSVGKDLQRNAEYKKIKQKFVDQWAQGYNQYYEKYGVVLGDDEVEPTFAVCGASICGGTGRHNALVALGTNSSNTIANPPDRLCQGETTDTQPGSTRGPRGPAGVRNAQALHSFFDQAGIRMPPGRAEGKEDLYLYLDTNGNPMEIQICFQWNLADTSSGSGNVMVIAGLTPDLARALDAMIDGKPDAQEGLFRQQGVANGTAGGPGVQWNSDNTNQHGTTNARTFDEDQVAVVTAHYKMNQ